MQEKAKHLSALNAKRNEECGGAVGPVYTSTESVGDGGPSTSGGGSVGRYLYYTKTQYVVPYVSPYMYVCLRAISFAVGHRSSVKFWL